MKPLASNKYKMLFTGRVHATSSSEDGIFGNHKGVLVNVAAYTQSDTLFVSEVKSALEKYDLNMVAISDIKLVRKHQIIFYKTASMRRALRRALSENKIQFEVFYTYDED